MTESVLHVLPRTGVSIRDEVVPVNFRKANELQAFD